MKTNSNFWTSTAYKVKQLVHNYIQSKNKITFPILVRWELLTVQRETAAVSTLPLFL